MMRVQNLAKKLGEMNRSWLMAGEAIVAGQRDVEENQGKRIRKMEVGRGGSGVNGCGRNG